MRVGLVGLAASVSSIGLSSPHAQAQVPQPPPSASPSAFVIDSSQLGTKALGGSPTAATVTTGAPATTSAPITKAKKAKAKASTPTTVAARLLDPASAPANDTVSAASAEAVAVAPSSAGNGSIPDSVWTALRKCESNGNYAINTGNGYYGAYQFAASTWRKLGYSGLPHEASPATQDEAARKLQAQQGWGPWPACTRKLGLR